MTLDTETLKTRLTSDIKILGLPVDFELDIRGYSKTYFGRYDPTKSKVIVYPLEYKHSKRPYNYSTLLRQTIHEVLHHYQWQHTDYKRRKGVMHNQEFFRLENKYLKKAIMLGLINPKKVEDLRDKNVYKIKDVII